MNQFLWTWKYLYTIPAESPSQNVTMKHQLHPRSIQIAIHLYFTVLIHQQNLNSNYNMVYFPFLSGTTFKVSMTSQIYPRFVGWITQLLKVLDLKQTLLAYLQPIENPLINYGTIIEIFAHSEQLSKQANMRYTHITFDVGAASKAYNM